MPTRRPDFLEWLARVTIPGAGRCRIPVDLDAVTSVGWEDPGGSDVRRAEVEKIWDLVVALYRTAVHPALQICIRRDGCVVLHRAIGHARGNAPQDPPDAPRVPLTTANPFDIFSASKAITAMVIHKLDEEHVLHLEDRVCDFIPEFGRHGKDRISLRHILSHKAGIPNLPREAIDLDLLPHPERIVSILCDARLRTRPGRVLAYHAVSGGFLLAEVVRRATGENIRSVLEKRIAAPLGFRWMRFGVAPTDLPQVVEDAMTGPPVPPPMSIVLRNALGVSLPEVVELANDPRFLTGIIPAANVVTTAAELSAFYQCLLEGGSLGGVRVFAPRTVQHATAEVSYLEVDLTLGFPIRYGLGFMLGGKAPNLFGYDNPLAFGHLGLTNVFSWADPERRLAVALLASGKAVVSAHAIRLVQLLAEITRAFPKIAPLPTPRS
ncbi:MAG TPA: serine hydrolase domain-containing protein [Myxococcota bacterium]|nr:serine hydrolase domain-containing protein [Myxococcota bacterium]